MDYLKQRFLTYLLGLDVIKYNFLKQWVIDQVHLSIISSETPKEKINALNIGLRFLEPTASMNKPMWIALNHQDFHSLETQVVSLIKSLTRDTIFYPTYAKSRVLFDDWLVNTANEVIESDKFQLWYKSRVESIYELEEKYHRLNDLHHTDALVNDLVSLWVMILYPTIKEKSR